MGSRGKSAPGNDGISDKVYKNYLKLRSRLCMLQKNMWRAKNVEERWKGFISQRKKTPLHWHSLDQYHCKESNRFCPEKWLCQRVCSKKLENQAFQGVWNMLSRYGMPSEMQNRQKWNSQSFGSTLLMHMVQELKIKEAMEHFWIPQEEQDTMMMYYNKFKIRFTTGDFTSGREWKLELRQDALFSLFGLCLLWK